MAEENVTLELLLNKATSPAVNDDDWDAIAAFCDLVNKEMEGPQYAVRLLAHKIQSPNERESLSALSTIEACVKNCGRTFHQEIGKFRFLNELIKVVSPKYLGSRTSERVKKRCVELMYSWYKGLPHETKIGEAYKMLKQQHIIKEDPTYMDKTFDPFPAPKPRRAEFEDEEKAKLLSKLLKSKNPDDLQAANRLIKNMVKEDAEKSERRSRRINELEAINNQVKLLIEMVENFSPSSSRADTDVMKELYENLERGRPKLFRLASETEENETDAINEILKVNDAVTRAMSMYMKRVQGKVEQDENGVGEGANKGDTSLLDLGFDSPAHHNAETASGASAILQSDFQNLGLGDAPPAASNYNDLGSLFGAQQQSQQQNDMNMLQHALGARSGAAGHPAMMGAGIRPPGLGMPPAYTQPQLSAAYSAHQPISSHQLGNLNMIQTSVFQAASATKSAATTSTASSSASSGAAAGPSALADLDAIGQSLLEKNRSKDYVPPTVGPPPKMTMNQLAASKAASVQPPQPPKQTAAAPQTSTSLLDTELIPTPALAPLEDSMFPLASSNKNTPTSPTNPISATSQSLMDKDDDGMFTDMVSAPLPPPSLELLPLTDVFVPLESIRPDESLSPVVLYDKNSLKSLIHFSENRPRPDVLVMVLSTLSTNSKAVKNFMFQAAVPKTMKVKLQPPSTTDLPAYNPILPPTAITQVLLVANPKKDKVRLKFKVSYILGQEPISDVSDAENFPVQ